MICHPLKRTQIFEVVVVVVVEGTGAHFSKNPKKKQAVCYFTRQSREPEFAARCVFLPKDGEALALVSAECDRPLIIQGRGLNNGSGHGDQSERV